MQGKNIDVTYAESVADALKAVMEHEYCLVILWLKVAETSNMELLRMIRNTQRMPIIVLADRLTPTDKVDLFQAGANAYMEQPVDFSICTAQAASLIQLYLQAKEENKDCVSLVFGTELIIDKTYRQVIVDGELLALTYKEFELLVCLAEHPCRIWSQAQLYSHVWNDALGISDNHTVKTHIGNLKKKLAAMGKDYIQNSRGVGYKFVPPACDA